MLLTDHNTKNRCTPFTGSKTRHSENWSIAPKITEYWMRLVPNFTACYINACWWGHRKLLYLLFASVTEEERALLKLVLVRIYLSFAIFSFLSFRTSRETFSLKLKPMERATSVIFLNNQKIKWRLNSRRGLDEYVNKCFNYSQTLETASIITLDNASCSTWNRGIVASRHMSRCKPSSFDLALS